MSYNPLTMREQKSTKVLFAEVLQQISTVPVKEVRIAFGELCELDRNIIQHHWTELSRGTPLEHAQLRFRLVTAEVQCMSCFRKYHPENGIIHCPNCGSFGAKILSGEEFHVENIETGNE